MVEELLFGRKGGRDSKGGGPELELEPRGPTGTLSCERES